MKHKEIVSGLLLIVVGLLFLASTIGTLPELEFRRLWPVILLVLGAGKLLFPNEEGARNSGMWLVFLAGIFLAHNFDVMRLGDSWPLFIVMAGLSVLMGSRCSKAKGQEG